MKIKPTVKVKELSADSRKVYMLIIRGFLEKMRGMSKELIGTDEEHFDKQFLGLGLEGGEEALITLIDEGLIRITNNEKKQTFGLDIWDSEEKKYRKMFT